MAKAQQHGRSMVNRESSQRVLSIDVARGITIAFMILVNDPGDWSHVYAQLDHSAWSGWTLTDLVFPNFLFLMGAAMIFSLESRIARGETGARLARHIVRRAVILFALDLFIAAFPHFQLTHLRLYGVLTRIAVCYLCAGLICVATRRVVHLAAIIAVLLAGYWILLRFVPVPGFGIPTHDMPLLDPYRNLTAWIDRGFNGFTQRTIHAGSLYNRTRDPEGLLSTLPAIGTVLLGSIAGLIMRMPQETQAWKRNLLAMGGVLFVAAGEAWSVTFPINKNLWTSSYVLFAAGCSLLALALCYWLVDMLRVQERNAIARAALWPWFVFGANAIVAYAVSELLVEILGLIDVRDQGRLSSAGGWIYNHGFAHGSSTEVTSLAFAMVYVVVCLIPSWLLWRRGVFVKV